MNKDHEEKKNTDVIWFTMAESGRQKICGFA